MTAPAKVKKPKASKVAERRNATGAEIVGRSRVAGLVALKTAAGDKFGEIDDAELQEEVGRSLDAIQAGNLKPVETMLYMQAKALDTLFTRLMHVGLAQTTLPQYQAHMGLALKAQAQSRAALQALVEAKNPRSVAFVRQANIAQQQQVNNGGNPGSRAREIPEPANELLEDARHEQQQRMVPGAQAAPTRGDTELETVGALHRATHAGRQGNGSGQ